MNVIMEKRILQVYSTWAKANLENQIEVSLKALGIHGDNNIKSAKRVGDFTVIDGDPASYSADLISKRDSIVRLVKRMRYRNVIEEFAYTWFNRFVALRFMEVHNFFTHGFRVLSNPSGGIEPEILKNLNLVAGELHLDLKLCSDYKQQGKLEELYRYVLLRQCSALSDILPMLFSQDDAYLELLLPKSLLRGETVLTKLLEIPEEYFLDDVEVIGWMYQFYISSKKDAVYASKKVITKDTLPAVTQLFTPDWIVRYMAQNSVGRLWLESYPNSSIKNKMQYYIEDAAQSDDVQKNFENIRYKNVNPEDIRIIEPCCGSGHILVYVFDLLFAMYEERGYQKREIPSLIFKKNFVGLDVDKRAVQLASFSLIMKARSINKRFFDEKYYVAPHVYELQDSKLLKDMDYHKQIEDLNLLKEKEIALIDYLVEIFQDGKTIGSLLKVKQIDFACLDEALDKIQKEVEQNLFYQDLRGDGLKLLRELSKLAKFLSYKYDVMITNPPYIGISSMEVPVKAYAANVYQNSKSDMFAMFMETEFVKQGGFMSLINMQSWMFTSSFIDLRESLLRKKNIENLAQLGAHAFETIDGEVVQTVMFVLRDRFDSNYVGTFIRLVDESSELAKRDAFCSGERRYFVNQNRFLSIPGVPFIYWGGNLFAEAFESGKILKDFASPRAGLSTGNNEIFERYWFEVFVTSIGFNATSCKETEKLPYRWYPCNSGGTFRKWSFNNEIVVDWANNGYRIRHYKNSRGNLASRPQNINYYFKEGLTWNKLSSVRFAVKYKAPGFIFDDTSRSIFLSEKDWLFFLLGFLCSKVTSYYLEAFNPTMSFTNWDIERIPFKKSVAYKSKVDNLVHQNLRISKNDWNQFEFSWEFKIHPLVSDVKHGQFKTISQFYENWEKECRSNFYQLKSNEEELNSIFIDIYGLQNELTPNVEDKDITVRLADKERDIRSLISYLIGLVMGRYSIDVDGLAYAGGEWDSSKYITYQPDDDGIVPIYTKIGMADGLTTKIIELIKLIYGEENYRQNIDFIADALGKKSNESSEETLNRYLNDGFYPDHLRIYQKRPIYWMFSSGKKAGFKCLVYMHRYNEDTLARINAKYYLPESTRKKNELDELNGKITKAEGREKTRLEKERQNLAAAYNEALEYGQVLDHMANQYIKIDLDDGVKVNYAKFQGVQFVRDDGTKVKKDLLVPLK